MTTPDQHTPHQPTVAAPHPARLPHATDRCQRWNNHTSTWRLAAETVDTSRYEAAHIPHADAASFVSRHHYLGSRMPATKHCIGLHDLHDDGNLVGVAVTSIPVNKRVLTGVLPDLQPYTESLELGRFVLADTVPANGETFFLGRAARLLRADGVQALVSFSDPHPRRQPAANGIVMPGHVGTIYAAWGGSTYTGRATARTLMLLPDGTTLNSRTLQKIRKQESGHAAAEQLLVDHGATPRTSDQHPAEWLQTALDDAGVTRHRHGGCHRYVLPVGTPADRRRLQVDAHAKPYPKQTANPIG